MFNNYISVTQINMDSSTKKKKKSVADAQHEGNFQLQPSSEPAKLDSSQWPLLLKVSAVLELNAS